MELMFAFTLLALRCVNIFYSKRVKDVETFPRFCVIGPSRTRARCRSKRGRTVRAWGGGRQWTWCGRWPRRLCRRLTRSRCATSNIDGVNTPALIGATRIASHPPAQPEACGKDWQIDHGRDEALRVAAPSLSTCNRTTAIGADCAGIASANEASASGNNILKCISTVSAELQHATVKA